MISCSLAAMRNHQHSRFSDMGYSLEHGRGSVRCGSLADGLQSSLAAQPIELDEACGVRGCVCCSGLGFAWFSSRCPSPMTLENLHAIWTKGGEQINVGTTLA